MDGAYRITTEHIRSLAITCHALDVQFDGLFNRDTICEKTAELHRSYDRLYHTTLLNLAISIRVSLNQEADYKSETSGVSACGLFDPPCRFSAKDVCDKIIHADSIYKPVEFRVRGAGCELRGTNYKGTPWTFGLGVGIFSEWVLDWLDRIEANRRAL